MGNFRLLYIRKHPNVSHSLYINHIDVNVDASADPEGVGGTGGPDPHEKSQKYKGFCAMLVRIP